MKLVFLGSGTGIPLNFRASPSLTVIIGNQPLVFDMGPGALRQLTKAGINFEKIGRIFITHFHPDHTSDVIHFLFATKNPSILKKRSPFVITGPVGTKKFIHRLQEAYGDWLSLPSEIMEIEELDVGPKVKKAYDGFTITVLPTNHSENSIAYRIEDESGKTVVYSGDTGFCKEIIEIADSADVLILEAAFPDGKKKEGHLTPSEAGRVAALGKVKKLVLTHFYPECLETDITAQCRKTYEGELVIASDLLHMDI